jgi:hypothetical protein
MRFRTTILGAGTNTAGIEVPSSVVEALGGSKRPKVRVTINGYTYRSSVAPMSGRYLVGVSVERRAAAGVAAGDEVDVDLELDTEPRTVDVPADLATALDSDRAARDFFTELSYSQKQWYVLPIEGAKTAATRERRVARAMMMLRERRKR